MTDDTLSESQLASQRRDAEAFGTGSLSFFDALRVPAGSEPHGISDDDARTTRDATRRYKNLDSALCRVGERPSAPWLTMAGLRDLDTALTAIRSGELSSTGFFPRRFPVNQQMTLATGFRWNKR
jgi:hypothetical protein